MVHTYTVHSRWYIKCRLQIMLCICTTIIMVRSAHVTGQEGVCWRRDGRELNYSSGSEASRGFICRLPLMQTRSSLMIVKLPIVRLSLNFVLYLDSWCTGGRCFYSFVYSHLSIYKWRVARNTEALSANLRYKSKLKEAFTILLYLSSYILVH